jgi:hypothetical protein
MEWAKLIHVSQRLTLSAPLPPAAHIIVSMRCKAAFDKPERNTALLVNEARMIDAEDSTEFTLLENTYLARDFRIVYAPTGKPFGLPAPPTRAPDQEVETATSPQAALIYRLLGGPGRPFISTRRRPGRRLFGTYHALTEHLRSYLPCDPERGLRLPSGSAAHPRRRFPCPCVSRRNTVDAAVVRWRNNPFRNPCPGARRDRSRKRIGDQDMRARSIIKCVSISLTTEKSSRS